MDESAELNESTVLAEFIARYVRDEAEGKVQPLADYLAQYPGHEDSISREFTDLEERRRGRDARRSGNKADRMVSHYRILRTLGRGGQGEVYLAEDTRLKRKVALKVVRGWEQERILRFKREAEATSRLQHPGICAVYDFDEDEGLHYIAMQYLEGVPLNKALDSARKDGGEITDPVHLIEKTARAIHVAHEAGLVHRDLKPGNIMVTDGGAPVVVDFGLVLDESSDTPHLTLSGQMTGTPAYLAPEQVAAQRIPIDRRADVYALGVTLYECLTLHQPFEAHTREQLFHKILVAQPPDPRRFNPAVTKDMRAVLETALEKDRDRRYQTALDLAEDLRRIREFEPVQARPAGPILKARRWTRRNRPLAAAILGIFLALVGGLAASLVLLADSHRERNNAEENFQMALDAVQKMLTNVGFDEERLAGLPKLDATRRALLWEARTFFEKFLEKRRGDTRIRREAVMAHFNVAKLSRQLGDLAVAEKEIARAVSDCRRLVAEAPENTTFRFTLASTLNEQARVLNAMGRRDAMVALLEESIALTRNLLDQDPDHVDSLNNLAGCLLTLGMINIYSGDNTGAEDVLEEAVRIEEDLVSRFPGKPDHERNLAIAHRRLSLARLNLDRLDEAHTGLQRAHSLLKSLTVRYPADSRHASSRALVLCTLGDIEMRRRRYGEAESLLSESCRVFETLRIAHPGRRHVRASLAVCLKFKSDCCMDTGEYDQAVDLLKRAETLTVSLHRESPDMKEYRSRLMKIYRSLVHCLRATDRLDEAREVKKKSMALAAAFRTGPQDVQSRVASARLYADSGYRLAQSGDHANGEKSIRHAVKILEPLVKQAPLVPEYRCELASALHKLAILLANSSRLDAAEEMHRRAMELRRELVKGFPGNGQYHSDLGGSLHYLAYVLGKFGKFEENRGVLKEAIEEQVAALRLAPGLKSAHTYLINHYSYYCSTLLRLNNPDGAADAIEELPRHLPSDSEAQLKAAWVLIGCARMTPVDDERRKKFAARAVGHLEKAVGLGFKDLKRLQKESRFGWLLGRKDYQQLLMRLEEKRDR